MIKGVLFDKDGTLLEFNSTMHYIYDNVLKTLKGRFHVPDLLIDQLKSTLGHLEVELHANSLLQFSTNPQIVQAMLETSAAFTGKNHWEVPFTRESLLDLIEEHSLGDDVPYTRLPGTLTTLDYLKNKDYYLGIATADTHEATVTGLKKENLLSYFSYLGTSSENSRPKPDSFMADKFCSLNNITPNELLIVGDSENDMVFAENSGAHFAGIASAGIEQFNMFTDSGYSAVNNIIEIIDIFHL